MSRSLHTLNTPPSDTDTLSHCLMALSEGDELLLIEDAVYFTLPAHRHKLPSGVPIHALAVDLQARGLTNATDISIISDPEFVNLTLHCNRVVSWF
ncbi:hypothetical protein ADINL_1677 [Nitrincola lacisaponensis]|uniref:tRNA 5-methylaminomethyl-2-thiouridine synthase TusB n=1 Tax=Nitrincola lacisaponensis TaxID=267850 RepID=A0A063Y4I8_9GAMM|nr:sulfurtransferase complex subunit TusB [Nitrincola lacisaponensis]KDE40040.1 hypothetical protein ADINL_1677 [Nitrincola lacisaponensis]